MHRCCCCKSAVLYIARISYRAEPSRAEFIGAERGAAQLFSSERCLKMCKVANLRRCAFEIMPIVLHPHPHPQTAHPHLTPSPQLHLCAHHFWQDGGSVASLCLSSLIHDTEDGGSVFLAHAHPSTRARWPPPPPPPASSNSNSSNEMTAERPQQYTVLLRVNNMSL